MQICSLAPGALDVVAAVFHPMPACHPNPAQAVLLTSPLLSVESRL